MPEYNAENTDFPIGATLVNIAKDTLSSSPHRLMSEESTIRYTTISFFSKNSFIHSFL